MSRAQVPQSAIDASVWFILGCSLNADSPQTPAAQAAEPELVQAVTIMLDNQESAQLAPTVLNTIQAVRERLRADASLTISATRYDQLRTEFLTTHQIHSGKGRTLWPVGSTTALKRAGGSWSAALAQAGLATSSTPKNSTFGKARFTAEQFQSAIADFTAAADDAGRSPTYQAYVKWQGEQKQQGRTDRPSGAAIRNTYGSWSAALAPKGDQHQDRDRP